MAERIKVSELKGYYGKEFDDRVLLLDVKISKNDLFEKISNFIQRKGAFYIDFIDESVSKDDIVKSYQLLDWDLDKCHKDGLFDLYNIYHESQLSSISLTGVINTIYSDISPVNDFEEASLNNNRLRTIIKTILEASKPSNLDQRQYLNQLTDFEYFVDVAGITADELKELEITPECIYNETMEPVCVNSELIDNIVSCGKEDEFISQVNAALQNFETNGVCSIPVQCNKEQILYQVNWKML